mgnify:CR=1 FL=1
MSKKVLRKDLPKAKLNNSLWISKSLKRKNPREKLLKKLRQKLMPRKQRKKLKLSQRQRPPMNWRECRIMRNLRKKSK